MTTMTEQTIREQERQRIGAIISHPESLGRRDLALHLALECDLPLDDAVTILKAATRTDSSQPPVAFELPPSREAFFTTTTAPAAPRTIIAYDVFAARRAQVEALRRRSEPSLEELSR